MQGRPLYRVFDVTVTLRPGGEQDFGPYAYYPGQRIRVATSSNANNYVGIFDAPQYLAFRRQGGRAPFLIGSARTGHIVEQDAQGAGQFYVVVRLSVWNFANDWPVRVTLEVG